MNCPHCQTVLKREMTPMGLVHTCPGCRGQLISMTVLRQNVEQDTVLQLWNQARQAGKPSPRRCPGCCGYLTRINLTTHKGSTTVEVCPACQVVWFDAGDFAVLPLISAPANPAIVTTEARTRRDDILGQFEQRQKKLKKTKEYIDALQNTTYDETPDHWWQIILGYMGMPIKYGNKVNRKPWATWTITSLCILISLYVLTDPVRTRDVINAWGLIPAKWYRWGGITTLTSFFLHGGWEHLIGNMYFFVIFGGNVEESLGRRRFLLLVLLSTIMADTAHMLWCQVPYIPCIGASGGISGVLTYYALRFPGARIGLVIWLRWVTLPAIISIGFWFALQVWGILRNIGGISSVSYLAHVGGALTGIAFWLFTRKFTLASTS